MRPKRENDMNCRKIVNRKGLIDSPLGPFTPSRDYMYYLWTPFKKYSGIFCTFTPFEASSNELS